SHVIALIGAPKALFGLVVGLGLPRWAFFAALFAVLLVIAYALEELSVMIIILPILFPLVTGLGFDPIWFGILMVLWLEIGLIPRTGGTGDVWTRQLEGLADVARVVAPDLPRHGQSGGAPRASIRECVAFVAGFLDALSVRHVVLGGHSMGGAVAQEFALTYPERVDGLILVGTGARLRVLPRLLELLATDAPEGVSLLMRMAVSPPARPALTAWPAWALASY